MPSVVFTGSVTATSTTFDISRSIYAPVIGPTTEVYLVVSSTVTCAVQQPLADGTFLATLDTTFTGPCSKLVVLRSGRSMRFLVNAAAQYTIEAQW